MKKVIILAASTVFALSFLTAGCDDEDKCEKCVDDYCDCMGSAGEDIAKVVECGADVGTCLTDNDCDQGEVGEGSCD